jgi:hypothetical protein
MSDSLYETDFYTWVHQQSDLLDQNLIKSGLINWIYPT